MERVIEHGCGLRASPWGHGPAGPGGTHLRHYGRRTPRPARLAGSTRSHACRHGERRRLLEADLLRPRGGVHVCAGQPGAHGAGAGAQNRRAGLRLDRPAAGAQALAGELRAASADPRTAGPHAVPQDDCQLPGARADRAIEVMREALLVVQVGYLETIFDRFRHLSGQQVNEEGEQEESPRHAFTIRGGVCLRQQARTRTPRREAPRGDPLGQSTAGPRGFLPWARCSTARVRRTRSRVLGHQNAYRTRVATV